MIRPRKSTTRLAVETLENRCVPAGSVTAELVPNDLGGFALLIVGDHEANHVHVRSRDDVIVVDGDSIFHGGWSPTLINGEREAVFDANQISDLVLVAGGGDDRVVISLDSALGCLDANMGAGFDQVLVSGTFDDVAVNTGQDRDDVLIIGAIIAGDLHIDTGHGSDGVNVESTTVVGSMVINTGNGQDFVRLFSLSLGHLAVNLGQDDDVLSFDLVLDSGPHVHVAGDALFAGGQGDDAILFDDALFVGGSLQRLGFE